MKICEKRGYPYYLAWAEVIHGWSRTAEGSFESGANEIRLGLASFDKTGGKLRRPYYLSLLAELCGDEGREDEGIALLDEAIELGKRTGERWREAELNRRKGSLMLRQRPTQYAEAERFFRRGIEVSQSQGAKSYEVLSATSLARMWHENARHEEAKHLVERYQDLIINELTSPCFLDSRNLIKELS